MSHAFDPFAPLIVVRGTLKGPEGAVFADLAIDTGSCYTVIGEGLLRTVGCGPETASEKYEIITGSKVEMAPRVVLEEIAVLDSTRTGFAVLCHSLPVEAPVEGVLGLDFFRGLRLIIDLREGLLSID
jgi:Aspartyl protease